MQEYLPHFGANPQDASRSHQNQIMLVQTGKNRKKIEEFSLNCSIYLPQLLDVPQINHTSNLTKNRIKALLLIITFSLKKDLFRKALVTSRPCDLHIASVKLIIFFTPLTVLLLYQRLHGLVLQIRSWVSHLT